LIAERGGNAPCIARIMRRFVLTVAVVISLADAGCGSGKRPGTTTSGCFGGGAAPDDDDDDAYDDDDDVTEDASAP
jgi:hypothetical protein